MQEVPCSFDVFLRKFTKRGMKKWKSPDIGRCNEKESMAFNEEELP
jgi:hypothetical protein